MTTAAPPHGGTPVRPRTTRRVISATRRASRSPWVWTPAAVGTAGIATATLALGRLLTAPPPTLRPGPLLWTLRMSPARPGCVRLAGPAASVAGRWGIAFAGGFGEVGEPEAVVGPDAADRPFRLFAGAVPSGTVKARLHAHVWPDRHAFTETTAISGYDAVVDGETGPLPAWIFPAGSGERWSILVHGRGAPRAQMLRLVPALQARGITTMVISYRNDSAACSDPSGRSHFGHREWHDLEAAVAAARGLGGREFILGGMSLGGAIIATFLRRSALAGCVTAAILDAPALNWGPILRAVARSRRVPEWLVPGAMAAASWQARIDWASLNHIGAKDRLTAPVLLVHGEQDPVVPVELSDAYAAAEPELVTYLRVQGAGHVSAWNTATAAYEEALATFLDGPVARGR